MEDDDRRCRWQGWAAGNPFRRVTWDMSAATAGPTILLIADSFYAPTVALAVSLHGPASPRGPRSGTARPGTSNKIIEGAPLFAGLDKRKGDSAQRGDDGGETRHSKEQPAPAK